MTRGVIRTRELAKRYGDTVALAGMDLEVPRNSIFGFLGPNGAGKSTAMKLLLGLARPSSGSGTVFGLDIERQSVAIRERVGYLAQEPRFYGHMTARETLRFVLRFFGRRPDADVDQRIAEALALVGLVDKADRPVRGFSGGERQRLGIAQAWIHDPDLLILDEPAASLDPMGRSDVLAILARLRERATVFYSTHILDDVQRVSDTVAILDRGRIVAQAPIEHLLAGDEGTTFEVTLTGALAGLRAQVEELPWVTTVVTMPTDGDTRWRVAVSDEDLAEELLLRRLLSEPGVRVRAFRRSAVRLEDVFLDLVRGGPDDGHPSG
ncbi:MAG: ABC transporter ATP-binding protein [Acidimicrobiia bacterium]